MRDWTLEDAKMWHWIPCAKTGISKFQGKPAIEIHMHISGCEKCGGCDWSWETEKDLAERLEKAEKELWK